jgi:hypothetical protein
MNRNEQGVTGVEKRFERARFREPRKPIEVGSRQIDLARVELPIG